MKNLSFKLRMMFCNRLDHFMKNYKFDNQFYEEQHKLSQINEWLDSNKDHYFPLNETLNFGKQFLEKIIQISQQSIPHSDLLQFLQVLIMHQAFWNLKFSESDHYNQILQNIDKIIVKFLSSNQKLIELIPVYISMIFQLQLTSYSSFDLLIRKSLDFQYNLPESEVISFLGAYYFVLKSNAIDKLGPNKKYLKERIVSFQEQILTNKGNVKLSHFLTIIGTGYFIDDQIAKQYGVDKNLLKTVLESLVNKEKDLNFENINKMKPKELVISIYSLSKMKETIITKRILEKLANLNVIQEVPEGSLLPLTLSLTMINTNQCAEVASKIVKLIIQGKLNQNYKQKLGIIYELFFRSKIISTQDSQELYNHLFEMQFKIMNSFDFVQYCYCLRKHQRPNPEIIDLWFKILKDFERRQLKQLFTKQQKERLALIFSNQKIFFEKQDFEESKKLGQKFDEYYELMKQNEKQ